jgi:hypothetical protein
MAFPVTTGPTQFCERWAEMRHAAPPICCTRAGNPSGAKGPNISDQALPMIGMPNSDATLADAEVMVPEGDEVHVMPGKWLWKSMLKWLR